MITSTWTTTTLRDIAKANGPNGVRWFYLDNFLDKEFNQSLIDQVELLGFKAIVITADKVEHGNRITDRKNKFRLPPHIKIEIFEGNDSAVKLMREAMHQPDTVKYARQIKNHSVTWDHISEVKKMTKLPIVLKGILTAEDAIIAVERGVQAVIVSNHGGRQLDGVPATVSQSILDICKPLCL